MWGRIKRAAKAVGGQIVNVAKEAFNRIIGLPDFVLTLLGIQIPKHIRVRVVVLQDENGQLLTCPPSGDVPGPDITFAVDRALDTAAEIFRREVKTKIARSIHLIRSPAPKEALEVGCQTQAWREDLGVAGEYFRKVAKTLPNPFGYRAPVTVVVVRRVAGEGGCSIGPLQDYVTIETASICPLRPLVFPHEIAHACGLWHPIFGKRNNLMQPVPSGEKLGRLQRAVFRNSRHVTFF